MGELIKINPASINVFAQIHILIYGFPIFNENCTTYIVFVIFGSWQQLVTNKLTSFIPFKAREKQRRVSTVSHLVTNGDSEV